MLILPDQMAALIDHTLLKPDATLQDILRVCSEAVEYRFKAVCVNPSRVAAAASALAGTGVAVCAVAGFPLGAATAGAKAAEAAGAVRDGASEIDMVISLGLLKDGLHDLVLQEVKMVVEAAARQRPGTIVKTIIETCYLTPAEKEAASLICERAGAGFIKTSTGMGPSGATTEDIELIRKTVSPGTGIKASGGIKTLDQALAMIAAGATRIGASSGVQIMRELQERHGQ